MIKIISAPVAAPIIIGIMFRLGFVTDIDWAFSRFFVEVVTVDYWTVLGLLFWVILDGYWV